MRIRLSRMGRSIDICVTRPAVQVGPAQCCLSVQPWKQQGAALGILNYDEATYTCARAVSRVNFRVVVFASQVHQIISDQKCLSRRASCARACVCGGGGGGGADSVTRRRARSVADPYASETVYAQPDMCILVFWTRFCDCIREWGARHAFAYFGRVFAYAFANGAGTGTSSRACPRPSARVARSRRTTLSSSPPPVAAWWCYLRGCAARRTRWYRCAAARASWEFDII